MTKIKSDTSKTEIIGSEIKRLVNLKGSDNWAKTRSSDNFKLVEKTYPFGKRLCYEKINIDNDYIDLQSSRGIGIEENDVLENVLSRIEDLMRIIESDEVRISEIDNIFQHPKLKISDLKHTGFVELGFRIPRLMKYYADHFNVPVWGYDVAPLSLEVTKQMGYDARQYDFNNCGGDLGLGGASLVVSYHMLEHLSDPPSAIKRIFEAMDKGSFFHVEVPIEPGVPRLNYGHMFAFHENDLGAFLNLIGFEVLTKSNCTHHDGPLIERYMARKP
ncbi:hypothetical protein CL614_08675 [archaeon]|nr:hypothetical protein [archaeon]